MHCDVLVAGGSISGLLAAREMAGRGLSVLVVEEDMEIGTPEHCGGLVSVNALKSLGMLPDSMIFRNDIRSAEIYSPSGLSFSLEAGRQGVIAIDRRALDKRAAIQASRNGARIMVRCSMRSFTQSGEGVSVETSNGNVKCSIMVDARGCQAMIERSRKGVLISAQYEVSADWTRGDVVEVHFDQTRYPGFFAWMIPAGRYGAKVGVAGRGINASKALDEFLERRGRCSVLRKIFAPIWVQGSMDHFLNGRVVSVGDAAGQTKPTTAGGIYSCGMAGILAGRAIADAIANNDLKLLNRYEREWFAIFGKEFERMLLARKVLEHLDNKAMDDIFKMVSVQTGWELSESGDFDFHAQALSKLLSVEGALRIAKNVLGSEIRRLFA